LPRPAQNLLTRLSKEMLEDFYGQGFWKHETIFDCAKAAAQKASQSIAVQDSNFSITYKELVDLAELVASDLASSGLKAGDRVAAWLPSRIETAAMLLACSRQGYVFCPSLHKNHTVAEVLELIDRMSPKAVIVEEGYGADADRHDIFADIAKISGILRTYRLKPNRATSKAQIADSLVPGPVNSVSPPVGQPDDVVYLAFTSGTTGQPKGVMHSNNTLLANARSIASDWHFDSHSVIYTLSPLGHNLGFGAMVLNFLAGARLVLHDLRKGQSLGHRLKDTATSFVFGVPAYAIDLLDELEKYPSLDLSNIKGFRISGAASPSWVVEKLLAHGIVPQTGFGMTEACSHHYTLPDDSSEVISSTSGKACPGYEVAVFSVEDPDAPVPPGEVGQLAGRGASLMLGYFDNQAMTEASFNTEGWFLTGDLARIDQNGYLQITGRIKDIIIRGGHNIHPAHIEQLASRYPGVAKAAALPVKDERLGEKVCIVVVPNNGGDIDARGLLSHLHAAGLSKYDMPEYFLQVADIPLGPSGKVQKRALLPYLESGQLKPEPIRWTPND
jgi:acyl-CoA synthetase (AMP-forming)/AMP-acid ligase II